MKPFFFYRKEKNGKWTKFEPLALVLLSFVVFSLSLSLSLSFSLSLSLSPSLSSPYTFFFVEEREGEKVWIQLMMQNFWRVVQCVGGGGKGGGRGVFVCPKVSCLSCFLPCGKRDNVKLIFVFDLKKEKLSEFERLGTVPSYTLFLFFFFVYC